MAERSFPFDDVGGDRQLDTAAWARHTAALTDNGVVPGFASELEVRPTAPESLAVDVVQGRFWIEGRYYQVFDNPVTVTLATADPTDPRIDRIVVRRSIANREVTVEALTGTPAPSPSPPTLTQSPSGDWEESLAQVLVAANATGIFAADITDERSLAQSSLATTHVLAEASNSTNRSHALDTAYTGDGDGVTFVAPATGKVMIMFHDRMDFEKAGTASVITRYISGNVQVRTGSIVGSGTAVNTPTIVDGNQVGSKSNNNDGEAASATSWITASGLTPGNDYNVEHVYLVNSDTNINLADSTSRRVLVMAVS